MEESIQKIVTENPDSLTVGSPSKEGALKIYGNFSEPEAFKQKIDNAKKVRAYAKIELEF